MNKKHFVVVDREQIKVKDWARQNQNVFPEFTFATTRSETPITNLIGRRLMESGYVRTVSENIVVYSRG